MATYTMTRGISKAGVNLGSYETTVTASLENNLDETIPGSTTDLAVGWNLDVSACKLLRMVAIGGNLTVETNSASAPTQTIALVDGVPIGPWVPADGTCPITADVTAGLFVTKAGAGAVQLKIEALVDATP